MAAAWGSTHPGRRSPSAAGAALQRPTPAACLLPAALPALCCFAEGSDDEWDSEDEEDEADWGPDGGWGPDDGSSDEPGETEAAAAQLAQATEGRHVCAGWAAYPLPTM